MIHRSHGYSITDYHQSSKASGYKNPLSPNPHKTEQFDLKRSNFEKISHLRRACGGKLRRRACAPNWGITGILPSYRRHRRQAACFGLTFTDLLIYCTNGFSLQVISKRALTYYLNRDVLPRIHNELSVLLRKEVGVGAEPAAASCRSL